MLKPGHSTFESHRDRRLVVTFTVWKYIKDRDGEITAGFLDEAYPFVQRCDKKRMKMFDVTLVDRCYGNLTAFH
jgi:hypothetical protein